MRLRELRVSVVKIIVAIAVIALAGCSKEEPATQPAGPRIISTVPAAAAQLVQLGAADALVGVSKYDLEALPPEKRSLPVVGDYETMNYELLLRLHPTAVVLQMAEERIPAKLREMAASEHFELVNLKLDTLADLFATARRLGVISGHEREAAVKIALARAELHELAGQNEAHRTKPRVLYVVSSDPMYVVGGKNYMDELIAAAGGVNAGAEAGAGYPAVNRETLLKLAPEVVLVGAPGEPASQGFSQDDRLRVWRDLPLPATANGRVYLITSVSAQWPTLDVAANVRQIAELLYPQAATRGETP